MPGNVCRHLKTSLSFPRHAAGYAVLLPVSQQVFSYGAIMKMTVAAWWSPFNSTCSALTQGQQQTYQPGAVHPAAWYHPTGALWQQAHCPCTSQSPTSTHQMEAWRYSTNVLIYQPDWLQLDHDAMDTATGIRQVPEQAWWQGPTHICCCPGELPTEVGWLNDCLSAE